MSEDLNKTMNGTQPSSCYWDPTAKKVGMTFAYCLIFLVSLAGNTVIGIIVYKTKTMRKPINLLIINMAMSDLLFPAFLIPLDIQRLYINSWLIGGPLGQALCKMAALLLNVSFVVSVQSLVLIAVDRFGVVVFPLRSPLISSKLCPFFILATWIIAMAVYFPTLFAFKLVEYPGGLVCELSWKEVFGESSSFDHYAMSTLIIFYLIPLVLIVILYIIIYIKLKSQNILGEQSANAAQQRQQRERNVLKMATGLQCACCPSLSCAVSLVLCIGQMVLWLPILCLFCLFYGSHKLCHQSLYLFHFQ